MVTLLYRLAMGGQNVRVILQNADDREDLVSRGVVEHKKVVLIPGSGVDLDRFSAVPEREDRPVVTFAGRLLRDKGVYEYIDAARQLTIQGVDAVFQLVGDLDADNPTSIKKGELEAWRRMGSIEIMGFRQDVAQIFADSNVVVLPSYREGFPKVLAEAAACGRAIITTDVPGCRDAVLPGKSGLLVPVRDPTLLAVAIRRLVEDADLRKRMGEEGRRLAEERFSIGKIVTTHLCIYDELIRR